MKLPNTIVSKTWLICYMCTSILQIRFQGQRVEYIPGLASADGKKGKGARGKSASSKRGASAKSAKSKSSKKGGKKKKK